MREADRVAEAAALIVVRAGAIDRFTTLQAAFTSEGVEVVWDRRLCERRRPGADPPPTPDRRCQERRGPAPASWALLDFLVVPGGPGGS
jgi:hypothetical protein